MIPFALVSAAKSPLTKYVIAALALTVAVLGGIAYHQAAVSKAYQDGLADGRSQVQSAWDLQKLTDTAEALKREKDFADAEAEIRLQHQELQHEIDKKEAAALAADTRNGRLQRAFNACANTVSSLGDSEAAARANAESLNDELRRIHEFHVRHYADADRVAVNHNKLIDWVDKLREESQ